MILIFDIISVYLLLHLLSLYQMELQDILFDKM